jgi:hypothetical protein
LKNGIIELPIDNFMVCTMDDFIPTIVRKPKKAKAPYTKPDSIKQLEEDWKVWHYKDTGIEPRLQYYKRYSDSSTNGLTKAIIAWLECHGHYGSRRNTTGTWSQALKMYIHSGSTNGAEDIDSTLGGINVKIEVKFKKDKPSDDQKKYRKNIENAGGHYIIVKTFDDFLKQISKYDK